MARNIGVLSQDTRMQLQDWIGRSEQSSDVATATPYAALSATLNRAGERPATGMVLPPLWH